MTDADRKRWAAELKAAKKKPRVLTKEPDDEPYGGLEACVTCRRRTRFWLQPENAPLCSAETSPGCLEEYLEDPSVYDPRSLYPTPAPVSNPCAEIELGIHVMPRCSTCIFINTDTCRTCVRPQMSNHIPRST